MPNRGNSACTRFTPDHAEYRNTTSTNKNTNHDQTQY